MLTAHREGIAQIVESVGSAEDISGIRIFNSRGKISYSTLKYEVGKQVDAKTPACVGCHADPEQVSGTLARDRQWMTHEDREGNRILTFTDPIYNEPSCFTAACHAHAFETRVLGILETGFSIASVDSAIAQQTRDITLYAVAFMAIGSLILYGIHRRFVLRPLSALSKAIGNVASGDLSQRIAVTSQDEMGMLSKSFNSMTGELEVAKERTENWAQTLEREIRKKTDELKNSQGKLIEAEKLAALGRLTADVAHEIRNPLTSIGGFARRLDKIVNGEKERAYSGIIVDQVDRLEKILKDVLTFSRDARFHLERNDIREVVHEALRLQRDICIEQSIGIKTNLEKKLPQVLIDKNQAIQALVNLITNAVDVMHEGGVLEISTGREVLHDIAFVFVKVSDTGPGLPENKLSLIFDPFFTTKEIGHGTGLGLSITRKIMEEHGGFIKAESEPGKGSVFSLYFPFQSEEETRKMPCWEFMKCGRDRDATVKCPAYPNFGRTCWVVAGTFCQGKVQGTFAQKCEDCNKCEFHHKVMSGESSA
jgi:two-component system NtrC family sensor kinase